MDLEREDLKEKIINVLRTSDELVYSFRKQIENKRAFIFIGLTKSGKTTLVKYLTNRPLVAFQRDYFFKIKDETSSSEIGHSSVSHTTIPSVYEWDRDKDTILIDAPGFEDNRGVLQEIENCLYINQIKYAIEVKFVLVSDVNNIKNDNINNFLSFVQTVQTILTNFDRVKQGVAIIFTKDDENCTRQEIADILRKKILDDDNLKCERSLIKHVVDHIELIGLFKMPTAEGVLRNEIDDNIKDAIFTTGSIKMNVFEIKYGISTSACNFLLESYLSFHELVENIEIKLNQFNKITLNQLKELLSEEFLILLRDGELEKSKRLLLSFVHDIKEVESSRFVENIPSGLRSLFIEKFRLILMQLKNIISADEMGIINEDSIEDISRKIEYVACIESVINMSYKTNNILKLYNETLIDLRKETVNICVMVKNEMDMRKEITNIVPKLLESEWVLLQLNQEYFSASTSDELSKMKLQLEGLLKLCEYFKLEILKRHAFKQNLTLETPRLISIIKSLAENESILSNVIEKETKNDYFSKLSSKEKSVLGTFFVCAGMLGFSYFKVGTFGVSLVLFAILDMKTKCVRKNVTKTYVRLQQKRLLAKSTILDEYLKKLS